jgi:hypothetical protein
VMQKEGRQFAASDVQYAVNERTASLAMNIAAAYPESAAVHRWMRTITLRRGSAVMVRDDYELRETRKPLQWTLMTCLFPEEHNERSITLRGFVPGPEEKPIILEFPASVAVEVEPIDLKDEQLRSSWGDRIYRIVLTSRENSTRGTFSMTVHQ